MRHHRANTSRKNNTRPNKIKESIILDNSMIDDLDRQRHGESVTIDERMTNMQDTMLQGIDTEANRIIAEMSSSVFNATQRLKNQVSADYKEIYSDGHNIAWKKEKLAQIKGFIERNIKNLQSQTKMNDSQIIRKPKFPSLAEDFHVDVSQANTSINQVFQQHESKQINQDVIPRRKKIDIENTSLTCLLLGLGQHMKMTHKTTVVRTFKCRHCKIMFSSAHQLAFHLIEKHGEVGYLDKHKRRFYIEEQSQQIFYEIQDLKSFIQKSDLFSGFLEDDEADAEHIDINDSSSPPEARMVKRIQQAEIIL